MAASTLAPATVALRATNLVKTFSDPKRGLLNAVNDVSFEVNAGEIFGLLGPNGAGKTTTLRILATLLKPTSGTAMLGGYDIVAEPGKVREQIGFLSGETGLYARMTPREILGFFGEMNGMSGAALKSRVDDMIKQFSIASFADTRTDKLSTGMKQRTAIARTLIHDPAVLILDEPTSGLDLPTARSIEECIVDAKKRGKCILYSTHVMEEAEYLCDRIAVISGGSIKMTGTMEELRQATGKQRLREIFLSLLGLE